MAYVDFDANNVDDILWYSKSTGDIGYWRMNTSASYTWQYLGQIDASRDLIIDVGPYELNSARSDIAFLDWRSYYSTTGISYWDMNSPSTFAAGTLGGSATTTRGWDRVAIEGNTDFTGDGFDDFVLWGATLAGNDGSRQGEFWFADTDGAGNTTWTSLGNVNQKVWDPIYANDFDGDGRDDILWLNKETGYLGWWDSGESFAWKGLGMASTDQAGAQWYVAGTGDFTNDGRADILWYDKATNRVGTWDLEGNGQWARWIDFGGAKAGENWFIQSVGDYTNDGFDDILWRENTTGAVGMWDVNNASGSWSWVFLGDIGWNWSVVQA